MAAAGAAAQVRPDAEDAETDRGGTASKPPRPVTAADVATTPVAMVSEELSR